MQPLKNRELAKGALLSMAKKAILKHVEQAQRCTFTQLAEVFKEPDSYRISNSAPLPSRGRAETDAHWLRGQLKGLRDQGFIMRVIDGDTAFYQVGSESLAELQAEQPADNVTPPRRVYLLGSPDYVPPKATPYRPGAMDFAACPSIQSGRVVPFQGEKEATHG